MLFAIKRAGPDTGADIYYLTKRLRETHQSNWLKMVYMFKYERETKYIPLILSVEKSGMIKWYIDG